MLVYKEQKSRDRFSIAQGAWVRGAPHVKHIKIMITLRFRWYRSLLSPVWKVCILQSRSWACYFDAPNIICSKFSKSRAHNLQIFQSGTQFQNTAAKLTWAQLSCQSLMSQHSNFRLYSIGSIPVMVRDIFQVVQCGSKLRVTLCF